MKSRGKWLVQLSPLRTQISSLSLAVLLHCPGQGARNDVERELRRLRKVEQMVVSDPEIMCGTPLSAEQGFPSIWWQQ